MAAITVFAVKNLLAAHGQCVELVGIRRRLEGIDVKREGVKLGVAVAATDLFGVRGFGEFREIPEVRWYETVEVGNIVAALIQRSVTHHVDN